MKQKVSDLIENLKKKYAPVKTQEIDKKLDEKCKVCGESLYLTKPCCNSGTKYKKCLKCGYKILVK